MKQEVVDKFNAVTDVSVEDYCKARDGGFRWEWFLQRARAKVVASGMLPQSGVLIFEPRYIDSADAVLNGLLASLNSAEKPSARAMKMSPWGETDIERWKQLALSFSAMMF